MSWWSRWGRRRLGDALLLAALLLILLSVLAALGSWSWLLDLLSHFRVQYLWLGLATGVGCALVRRYKSVAVAAVAVLTNLFYVAPLYMSTGDPGAPALSVVSFNVNFANPRRDEVIAYLGKGSPDVVVVLELTPRVSRAIETAFPEHTWTAWPRTDAFGLGVLTRRVPRSVQKIRLGDSDIPAMHLVIDGPSGPIAVLAIHPPPPVSAQGARERDEILAAAGRWAVAQSGPAVVVGDFNATAWSAPFRALLRDTDLVNSQRGHGPATSWPAGVAPMAIAIDHLLHSPELAVAERSLGPFLGSDHRPLQVELAVNRAAATVR